MSDLVRARFALASFEIEAQAGLKWVVLCTSPNREGEGQESEESEAAVRYVALSTGALNLNLCRQNYELLKLRVEHSDVVLHGEVVLQS